MEQLVGKIGTIAVDYLGKEEGLLLQENVEIMEEKEVFVHELIGKRIAIKVKSVDRPKPEKWIMRYEIVNVRNKG